MDTRGRDGTEKGTKVWIAFTLSNKTVWWGLESEKER